MAEATEHYARVQELLDAGTQVVDIRDREAVVEALNAMDAGDRLLLHDDERIFVCGTPPKAEPEPHEPVSLAVKKAMTWTVWTTMQSDWDDCHYIRSPLASDISTEEQARQIAAAYQSYDRHCGPNAIECAEGDLLGELIEACRAARNEVQFYSHGTVKMLADALARFDGES